MRWLPARAMFCRSSLSGNSSPLCYPMSARTICLQRLLPSSKTFQYSIYPCVLRDSAECRKNFPEVHCRGAWSKKNRKPSFFPCRVAHVVLFVGSVAFRAMGGTDFGGFCEGHSSIPRHMPSANRDSGETRIAFALGQRPAERSVCCAACGPAGVCGRLSRVLRFADL